MKHHCGKWGWLVALCILVLCAGLGEGWLASRKTALSMQLSTNLTVLASLIIVGVWLLVTGMLGRYYCMLLCPAGIVQELFSRLGAKLHLRRLRYVSTPGKALLLAVVGVTSLLGFRTLAQLTDPIGLFGRLAMPLAQAWRYVVNGEGTLPAPGQTLVWAAMIGGAILLVVLPLFKGRIFCDRFCPVGAMLGVAASAWRKRPFIGINPDKCVSCGQCASVCPVQCVDPAGKTIALDRCLECGACARVCKFDAVVPRSQSETLPAAPKERRSFLASVAVGAAGVFVLSRPVSALIAGDSPTPQITPPGTGGDTLHRRRCVGCQACIASCPMHIIQLKDGSDLRPVLNYDLGFCHYNCRACLDSCPANAFDHSLPLESRQLVRVARVALELPRCVPVLNGTACGACAEVCPTHALQMIEQGEGRPSIPNFDPDYCIGCGACYHACPAEPRAFVMRGLAVHETALGIRPSIAPEKEREARPPLPGPGDLTDFPF